MNTRERMIAMHDGGPLDGTRTAQAIAETCPEANQEARMEDWRADFKRRVRERMEAGQP